MRTTNLTVFRSDVYKAIDTEREYQENLARNTAVDQRPIESLALIETIIRRAKDAWYDNPGPFDMAFMRKIAGVAVRSMEQHGAPRRG